MAFALRQKRRSTDETQFTALLSHYPKLTQYWNLDKRECDIEIIKRELVGMGLGINEKIMLKFLVMVWLGIDVLNFSMIDAINILDADDLEYIVSWTNKPFFP